MRMLLGWLVLAGGACDKHVQAIVQGGCCIWGIAEWVSHKLSLLITRMLHECFWEFLVYKVP
jgi:hypothetical protein